MMDHKLQARIHKCHFLQTTVDYLGYIVRNDEVRLDPRKMESIEKWPLPSTITQLHSFIRMTNTLLRFTPMYMELATPLTDYLKGKPEKSDSIDWTAETRCAFEQLKKTLTSAPNVLTIPDPSAPIHIHMDWSIKALGGWISQEKDRCILPITFKSWKLNKAERNYSPY
jgi:hypothetical protein